jgi:N-acetylglucosamine-6-sulfatase
MSDDHAVRTISAYNKEIAHTPNIDRIADEGALFKNSFVSNSICQPARASIMTGKHSHMNGVLVNGSKWNNDQTNFPYLLKKNGYQTALIGKWHIHNHPEKEFSYWEILTGSGGQGDYFNPDFINSLGREKRENGYSTDIITDKTLQWLSKNKKKPFMMMCNFKAPHVHRIPPPRYQSLYKGKTIPEPATLYDDYSHRQPYASKAFMKISGMKETICNLIPPEGKYDINEFQYKALKRMTSKQRKTYHKNYDPVYQDYIKKKNEGQLDSDEQNIAYKYQRFIKDYLGCVAAIDENVGRILTWLKENQLEKNTMVVYSSDQSYYTGEHSWAEKRFMYEESFTTPLLMRWPGKIKPKTKIKQLVQNIDYAPTFLKVAGVPVPKDIQGRSLMPLLNDSTNQEWRDSLYYHYYHHTMHNVPRHDGIRTSRYKLIHFYTEDQWELFDLKQDPREMKSEYNNPEYKKITQELTLKLKALRKEYKVPPQAFQPPYLWEKKRKKKNRKNKRKTSK